MKEFWDKQFSEDAYVYGTDPNAYFKYALEKIKPSGHALFPAEGEGRNATYGAKKGLKVTAFDYSRQAQIKALKLACAKGVAIDYHLGELEDLNIKPETFDLIVLIFAHFEPAQKERYYTEFSKYLKPGGYIIAEVFSKDQLKFRKEDPLAGGPHNINMLVTTEDFKKFFALFEIIELEQKEIKLNEGLHHKGKASVIRFIGRKPY